MLCIQFEATPVKRAEFNSFGALSPVYAKNNVIFVKNPLTILSQNQFDFEKYVL